MWKLAAVWDPIQWLRLRGSLSQDIRAAGFRELYYSQSIPSGGFFGATTNPWLQDNGPNTQRDETVLILSGNPGLEPEEADTLTVGFVLSPGGWADGMHFSADYYHIKLTEGIVLGNSANVVRDCFQGVASQCDFITFGPPTVPGNAQSNIVELRAPYINAQPYESSGVDLSADYTLPLSDISAGAAGVMSFRLSATYSMETLVRASGGIIRDISGQTGGDQGFLSDFAASPDWSANLVVTYANGPFMLTAQGRFISDGILDLQTPKRGPGDPGYAPNQTTSVNDNTVPSYFTMNLSSSYDFSFGALEKMQVFATLNNVFDREPPFSAGQVGGVNGVFFDTMGRTYRVGMRLRF
jgi:outer membrane receptor protein involved in Fe transport